MGTWGSPAGVPGGRASLARPRDSRRGRMSWSWTAVVKAKRWRSLWRAFLEMK